jgi:hypothetical protein
MLSFLLFSLFETECIKLKITEMCTKPIRGHRFSDPAKILIGWQITNWFIFRPYRLKPKTLGAKIKTSPSYSANMRDFFLLYLSGLKAKKVPKKDF